MQVHAQPVSCYTTSFVHSQHQMEPSNTARKSQGIMSTLLEFSLRSSSSPGKENSPPTDLEAADPRTTKKIKSEYPEDINPMQRQSRTPTPPCTATATATTTTTTTTTTTETKIFGPNFVIPFNPLTPQLPPTPLFELVEQPKEQQRKSYKKENRYLLPHPLIVRWVGDPALDVVGTVTAYLLDDSGKELEPPQQDILCGQKSVRLDGDRCARFALKLAEASCGEWLRLGFLVHFHTNVDSPSVVKIISDPFVVESNVKRSSIDYPLATALLPRSGDASTETEVWIRGKNFHSRGKPSILVRFGGTPARIEEVFENLIVCKAPVLHNPTTWETTVEVSISNVHPVLGELPSAQRLSFTYKVEPSRTPPSRIG